MTSERTYSADFTGFVFGPLKEGNRSSDNKFECAWLQVGEPARTVIVESTQSDEERDRTVDSLFLDDEKDLAEDAKGVVRRQFAARSVVASPTSAQTYSSNYTGFAFVPLKEGGTVSNTKFEFAFLRAGRPARTVILERAQSDEERDLAVEKLFHDVAKKHAEDAKAFVRRRFAAPAE